MNELSLFTGAGGGVLGSKLLGWRTIGYVEWEPYCQEIISQRIADGIFDEAPIFGDVDDFVESGAAKKYEGYVDVVTAGFPCTPFSNAGKQRFEKDSRNKWPETIQTIRDVRPRYALLENVPGLLSSGYFPTILADLAEEGFDVEWIVLGADDVGAPHHRKRLWILAHADSRSRPVQEPRRAHRELPQESQGLRGGTRSGEAGEIFGGGGEALADTRSSRGAIGISAERHRQEGNAKESLDGGDRRSRRSGASWWTTEPGLGRLVDGMAHRNERLRALGNGQVPLVVASAWRILMGEQDD